MADSLASTLQSNNTNQLSDTAGLQASQTQGTSTTNQGASSAANNANTYTSGQQGLQSLLTSLLGNFASTGNLPGTFAAPSQVTDAYNNNFAANVAPGIAATFGSGSPQIAAQQAMGQQSLLSNLYQTQSANFSNVLGNIFNAGYTPVGNTAAGSTAGTSTTTGNSDTNSQYTQVSNLLSSLLSSLNYAATPAAGTAGNP